MNKKAIITALLAVVCMAGQAKDKVIERPAFKSETTSDLIPVKVERTKEARARCLGTKNVLERERLKSLKQR